MNQTTRCLVSTAFAISILAACSAAPPGAGHEGKGAQGGSGGQDTTTSQGSSWGNRLIGTTSSSSSSTGGTSSGGDNCAGVTSKAEQIPLDIYLMLDSSGSMAAKTGSSKSSTTKWAAITAALSTFFSDPASAGLGVGLQHFPLPFQGTVPDYCYDSSDCPGTTGPCSPGICTQSGYLCASSNDCTGYGDRCDFSAGKCENPDSCTAEDYATPAVEIAALSISAASDLNTAISLITPNGNTPTVAALTGAIQHVQAWAKDHPTHTVVALMATDGLPTECSVQDIPSIAKVASAAASASPSVKTFAIGVFSPADINSGAQTNLDRIASAGGTNKAYIVDTSQDVEASFLAALDSIRGTKLACEYAMPTATGGGTIDYGKVNVEYSASASAAPKTVGFTESEAKCDATNGGWYYNIDPATGGTPTKIIVCPATCSVFGNAAGGQVSIRVGCTTVVGPPPL